MLSSFVLRAGYMASAATKTESGSGFGLGFGLRVCKATLDYAFSPYGELGQAQRASLSIKF